MSEPEKEPETTTADIAHALAMGMAENAEALAPLRDAVRGYKQSYMDDGFSEQYAEMMAVQYHGAMMEYFSKGSNG